MRKLSDITDKPVVTNDNNAEQIKDTLTNITNDLIAVNTEINNIKATLNNNSNTYSTNTLTAATITTNDLTGNNASLSNIDSNSITANITNTTDLTADTGSISQINNNVLIGNQISSTTINNSGTVTTNGLLATNLTATNATIENIAFDNFNTANIIAENITSDTINNNNKITTGSFQSDEAVISDLTTNNAQIVDLSTSTAEIDTLTNRLLNNTFRNFKSDTRFIDITQSESDTGYNIIKIPGIADGWYRLRFQNLDTGASQQQHEQHEQQQEEKYLIHFDLLNTNTYDNNFFSYYRNPYEADEGALDKIVLHENNVYLQTSKTGRLYYNSDCLENTQPPQVYADWPIDIDGILDYPVYICTRNRATVYSNYVNVGMEGSEYGTAELNVIFDDTWDNVVAQGDIVQYNPSKDTSVRVYLPDQEVNTDSDVLFNNGEITDSLTIGRKIKLETIQDDQYLIKRSIADELTPETPKDSLVDDITLDRQSKVLVTERSIAQWNGATDRQYQSYQSGTGQTITETLQGSGATGGVLFKQEELEWQPVDDWSTSVSSFVYYISGGSSNVQIGDEWYNYYYWSDDYTPQKGQSESELDYMNRLLAAGYLIGLGDNNNNEILLQDLTTGEYTEDPETSASGYITNGPNRTYYLPVAFNKQKDSNATAIEAITAAGITTNNRLYKITNGDNAIFYNQNGQKAEFNNGPYDSWTNSFKDNTVTGTHQGTGEATYSSSITHVNKIIEGEWDAGEIKTPNLTVANNATIGGDLLVQGKVVTVHSEEITTEEDTIELRHDATTGLVGKSGIIINNYDGNGTDSGIVIDSTGTLRAGDTNNEAPLALRDEASNINNNALLKWNSSNQKLVDSGYTVDILTKKNHIVGFDNLDCTVSYGINTLLSNIRAYYITQQGFTEVLFEALIQGSQIGLTKTTYGHLTMLVKASSCDITWIAETGNGIARYYWDTDLELWMNYNMFDSSISVVSSSGDNILEYNNLHFYNAATVGSSGTLGISGSRITFTEGKSDFKSKGLVIPTSQPSDLENGMIWVQ